MGDFARVSAHRPRWQTLPGIRDFEHGNRICLFCWVHAKHRIVDSEWHAFFACPTCSGPRRRFRLALSDACRRADIVETPLAIFDEQQWRIPLSCDLVRLVILCRKVYTTRGRIGPLLCGGVVLPTARVQEADCSRFVP